MLHFESWFSKHVSSWDLDDWIKLFSGIYLFGTLSIMDIVIGNGYNESLGFVHFGFMASQPLLAIESQILFLHKYQIYDL